MLVLSGRGVRYLVFSHRGPGEEFDLFSTAVAAARGRLASGHARAFVALRIEAEVVDGVGDSIDRELARFEVYGDRVALVPPRQGGLSDAQRTRVLGLSRERLSSKEASGADTSPRARRSPADELGAAPSRERPRRVVLRCSVDAFGHGLPDVVVPARESDKRACAACGAPMIVTSIEVRPEES